VQADDKTTIRTAISAAIDAAALALDYEECVSVRTRRESAARAVSAFLRDYSKAVRWPGDDLVFIADVAETLANE